MPVRGPVSDPNRRADGHCVFGGDRQARAQHRVDLAEVACQCLLINDLDHVDQPVGCEGGQPVVGISLQEHVTGKERNNRLDFPPLGRATFLEHLRKVVDEPRAAKVAGRRLFLTRLCMQTPPDRLFLGADRRGSSQRFGGCSRARRAESALQSSEINRHRRRLPPPFSFNRSRIFSPS